MLNSTPCAAGADPLVELVSGDAGVRVTAPRALLDAGERGVLLVALGCAAPESLLDEGADLLDIPPAAVTAGARSVYVSVLVSGDGGASYADIVPERLEAAPLGIALWGFAEKDRRPPTLYSHPGAALFGPMALSGASGAWQRHETVAMSADTLAGILPAAGVLGVFNADPAGPRIAVTPGAEGEYIVGLVRLGDSADTPIVVENTGTDILEGMAVLDGGAAFTLDGVADYRLGAGQRTAPGTLTLRFAPETPGEHRAILNFSGNGEPVRTTASLAVVGVGVEEGKTWSLLGCRGPNGGTGSDWPGDLLVVLAVLGLLIFRPRRATG